MEGTVDGAVEKEGERADVVDVSRGNRLRIHVLRITRSRHRHLEQVLNDLAARDRLQLHRVADATTQEGAGGLEEVVDVVVGGRGEGAKDQPGGRNHVHVAVDEIVARRERGRGRRHAGVLVRVVEGVQIRSRGDLQARAMKIAIAQIADVLVSTRESGKQREPQTELPQDGDETTLHCHCKRLVARIRVALGGNEIRGVELLVRIHAHQSNTLIFLRGDLSLRLPCLASPSSSAGTSRKANS